MTHDEAIQWAQERAEDAVADLFNGEALPPPEGVTAGERRLAMLFYAEGEMAGRAMEIFRRDDAADLNSIDTIGKMRAAYTTRVRTLLASADSVGAGSA